MRRYEEDNFASNYDSFLPSGTGSQAKKNYIARALMYAIETRMEGTAQVFVDLLIQVKGDISSKGIFCSLIEEYKAGDASDVRRDLAALSANAIGGLRAAQLRLMVLANQHRIATGMQLSSAEVRDYALDALDPAKGHAPAALADTHARQVEVADDADAVFEAFEKTVKRIARNNPKSVEFGTSGGTYCNEAVTAAAAAFGHDKPAPSPGGGGGAVCVYDGWEQVSCPSAAS